MDEKTRISYDHSIGHPLVPLFVTNVVVPGRKRDGNCMGSEGRDWFPQSRALFDRRRREGRGHGRRMESVRPRVHSVWLIDSRLSELAVELLPFMRNT